MTTAHHDTDLGDLLSAHRAQQIAPLGIFALAVLFAILGVSVLSKSQDVVGSVISFTAMVGFLTWAGWLYSREVVIYEGGVRYITLFSQRTWQWEDLDAVQFGVEGGRRTYPTYTLYRNGRIALQISTQFRDVLLAGELLTRHTRDVFVERELVRIRRGETVTFSRRFAISQTGIRHRQATIPWHAISEVVLRAWKLYIIEAGHEQRVVDLYGMRNPHVAVELISLALHAHAQPHTIFSLN